MLCVVSLTTCFGIPSLSKAPFQCSALLIEIQWARSIQSILDNEAVTVIACADLELSCVSLAPDSSVPDLLRDERIELELN